LTFLSLSSWKKIPNLANCIASKQGPFPSFVFWLPSLKDISLLCDDSFCWSFLHENWKVSLCLFRRHHQQHHHQHHHLRVAAVEAWNADEIFVKEANSIFENSAIGRNWIKFQFQVLSVIIMAMDINEIIVSSSGSSCFCFPNSHSCNVCFLMNHEPESFSLLLDPMKRPTPKLEPLIKVLTSEMLATSSSLPPPPLRVCLCVCVSLCGLRDKRLNNPGTAVCVCMKKFPGHPGRKKRETVAEGRRQAAAASKQKKFVELEMLKGWQKAKAPPSSSLSKGANFVWFYSQVFGQIIIERRGGEGWQAGEKLPNKEFNQHKHSLASFFFASFAARSLSILHPIYGNAMLRWQKKEKKGKKSTKGKANKRKSQFFSATAAAVLASVHFPSLSPPPAIVAWPQKQHTHTQLKGEDKI